MGDPCRKRRFCAQWDGNVDGGGGVNKDRATERARRGGFLARPMAVSNSNAA